MIKVNFPRMQCKYCGSTEQYALLKKYRYGIYCVACNKLIKWVDNNETVVIKGRKEWLENHDQNRD